MSAARTDLKMAVKKAWLPDHRGTASVPDRSPPDATRHERRTNCVTLIGAGALCGAPYRAAAFSAFIGLPIAALTTPDRAGSGAAAMLTSKVPPEWHRHDQQYLSVH